MAITVTCPTDGAQFAVVEPDSPSQFDSLIVTCPSCGEELTVVYPDELTEENTSRSTYGPYGRGEIIKWELHEDPPNPYTGSDKEIPVEQYITAKITGIGGDLYGAYDGDVDQEKFDDLVPYEPGPSDIDPFQIWYTPDHDEITYVVRADVETGVKTKNVYGNPAGGLFVKNRGIPRDSDKQWTYLDRGECHARAAQAGLSREMAPASEQKDRYNIFLEHEEQPLVDSENELSDELVSELARMFIAFQTKREA